MSPAAVIACITAFFKFPSALADFARLLMRTPEEAHDALLNQMAKESARWDETGRPTW